MDPTAQSSGSAAAPLLISGDNNQQLVLSAEDAAQLLAQAGIQLGDNEQVIIGDVGGAHQGQGAAQEGDTDIAAADADALDQQQVRGRLRSGHEVDQNGLLFSSIS